MVVDGSTLYVARCGWSVIDEIDAATLAKTGSISAPNIDGTCDLAEAGGALWYTNTSNHLVSVTLGATPTTTDTGVLADGELATTPAHPDWLVSVFSEAYIRVYDVTDPTAPTQLGTTFAPQNADAINDITATPNGADVVVASGAPYELLALALPGLTADGVYPTQPYPNSVAVSPDGSLIAGGTMSYYDPDVWLFPAGNSTVRTKWDFGSTNDTLYPHGLAFSADGSRLYAVSQGASGTGVILHVLAAVTLPKGSIGLKTSAAAIVAGHAVSITAHLGTSSSNGRGRQALARRVLQRPCRGRRAAAHPLHLPQGRRPSREHVRLGALPRDGVGAAGGPPEAVRVAR